MTKMQAAYKRAKKRVMDSDILRPWRKVLLAKNWRHSMQILDWIARGDERSIAFWASRQGHAVPVCKASGLPCNRLNFELEEE